MRDLLIHAARYDRFGPHVTYAARLGKLFDSQLTGLFVTEPYIAMPAPSGAEIVPELVAFAERNLELARAAGPAFQAAIAKMGLADQADWQVAEGGLVETLAYVGNWHDVLILEHNNDDIWTQTPTLARVLIGAGLPCLVIPSGHEGIPRLDTVLIAWNGSPEVIRALHAARPLLARAQRIVVAKGTPSSRSWALSLRPAFDLDAWLARHRLQVEYQLLDVADSEVGTALLTSARDCSAGLIVMGACGRSRFSEWILGSTTRHVLSHSEVPLFLRH